MTGAPLDDEIAYHESRLETFENSKVRRPHYEQWARQERRRLVKLLRLRKDSR